MKNNVRNIIHPTCEVAMAMMKGAKSNVKEQSKAIYNIYRLGVPVKDICVYCKMNRPTVSNTIRRYRKSKQTIVKRKIG